jgi:N-acetylglucosaminyl-diphospho-decaprenol L-rhamnosyltransferase
MSGSFPPRDSMATSPDVSVIIVSYNSEHLLPRTLAALQAGCGQLLVQVIVIDNASRDRSVELLKRDFPNVELIENATNLGFGRANNQAVSRARGRYILLLNPDAFVSADTLPKTVSFMDAHPRSGVLGVKLVDESGHVQPSVFRFPTPWNVFVPMSRLDRLVGLSSFVEQDSTSLRACDWVQGCFYLIRNEVIKTVGLFDPRYFLFFEEIDHCRSLKSAGWNVIYYPYAPVTHLGGESTKCVTGGDLDGNQQVPALLAESEFLYYRKHYGVFVVFASLFFTILTDFGRVLKRLVVTQNAHQALAPMNHLWMVIQVLVRTRMGARPVH